MLPAMRRLPLRAVTIVLGTLLTACAAPVDDPRGGKLLSRIAGGEQDSTHSSVFGTVTLKNGRTGTCTATLIAPNLLVTARHCIAETASAEIVCGNSAFSDPIPPANFIATNAVVLETSREWFEASKIEVPEEGNDTCGFDIALVTLTKNVPANVATPTVPRIDRGVTLGEEYIAVGYGIDENGTAQPRSVLRGLEVMCEPGSCGSGVRVTEFRGASGVCEGDSGGPALDLAGKVVGVVSRGGAQCSRPIYGSINAWRELIQRVALEAAEAGGYDAPFWATSGQSDPPSDNPPVAPNPPPTGTGGAQHPSEPVLGGQGDSCSSGADCQSGFGCYQPNSTSVPFCVERCDAEADCEGNQTCTSVGGGNAEASVCLERRDDPVPAGAAGETGAPSDDATTSEAGCAIGARATSSPAAFVAVLVFALALARRRRV
jgi:MYXO-CTERM domain-containing protein